MVANFKVRGQESQIRFSPKFFANISFSMGSTLFAFIINIVENWILYNFCFKDFFVRRTVFEIEGGERAAWESC